MVETQEDPPVQPPENKPSVERMWTWFIEYIIISVAMNRIVLHTSELWPTVIGQNTIVEWSVTSHTATVAAVATTQLISAVAVGPDDTEATINYNATTLITSYIIASVSLLHFLSNGLFKQLSTMATTDIEALITSKPSLVASFHLAIAIVSLYISLCATLSYRNSSRSQFTVKVLAIVPPTTLLLIQTSVIKYTTESIACSEQSPSNTATLSEISSAISLYQQLIYFICAVLPVGLGIMELLRSDVLSVLPEFLTSLPVMRMIRTLITSTIVRLVLNVVEMVICGILLLLYTITLNDATLAKNGFNKTTPWSHAILVLWGIGLIVPVVLNLLDTVSLLTKTPTTGYKPVPVRVIKKE